MSKKREPWDFPQEESTNVPYYGPDSLGIKPPGPPVKGPDGAYRNPREHERFMSRRERLRRNVLGGSGGKRR